MTSEDALRDAVDAVPAGSWAVGVSGGADSVALLTLLRERRRGDVRVRVAHFDHETREGQSAADAAFVRELCARLGVWCAVVRRSAVEPRGTWPANRSARFRAMRLHWFGELCARERLLGVILAHHADDQAETFVQRLLRGSGPAGLAGMRAESNVRGLRVLRPLLGVTAAALRGYLAARGQGWREDASNASPAQQRNRVRAALAGNDELTEAALAAAGAMGRLNDWARGAAPVLGETFGVRELAGLPDVLAREAARRWLAGAGADRAELSAGVLARLIEMARDAGTAGRVQFPGGVMVWRKQGRVGFIPPSSSPSIDSEGMVG